MVSIQPEKAKTKAKQRYLKVKRDRRKKRKTAAVQALHKANVKSNVRASRPQEVQNDTDEESVTSSDSKSNSDRPENILTLPASEIKDSVLERPRKRRKATDDDAIYSRSSSSSSSSSRSSSPMETRSGLLEAGKAQTDVQPVEKASLLAFQMPSAAPAASQKMLALQGLDPGLIDAEIVDAARTAAIDSSDLDEIDYASTLGLSLKTRKRLKELGIVELFAVQTALLPFLLPTTPFQRALYMPYNSPRDVCVSAPTGSGKTLAYVLPILELLSNRVVTRLRALIVLPTRDLVTQVRETFEAVCKGRGLKIASATGQHSFTHEQAQIVDDSSIPLHGGSSKVDILICTPGRLMDHLGGTPDFTLQHLRFLVIDEADRLLTQSFQDWLSQVLSATRPSLSLNPTPSDPFPVGTALSNNNPTQSLPYHDALAPAWLPFPHTRTHVDETRETSCQKLLFSATLTRDPAKISALELREAKYFVVKDNLSDDAEYRQGFMGETFVFPATLGEHMTVCTSHQKPLVLFYLVHKRGVTNALVFTKSAESTTRLVKLFECFENVKGRTPNSPVARAYSSDLSAAERKIILEKFKSQEITILVCSDLVSRGIDISHVAHVVSYDAPVDMRKYVHRVGRTARAGRKGDAWSLVEEQEARYFKSMLSSADHLAKVHKLKLSEDDLGSFKNQYDAALRMYSAKQDDAN